MLRADFAYDLPPELIAQEPRPRGQSRMMLVQSREGEARIDHLQISDFPSLLDPDDVVVLNDTRVFPARLFAAPRGNQQSPTEVLLTRHLGGGRWECLARPGRRVKAGDSLVFSDTLSASAIEKQADGTVIISFDTADEQVMWEEIDRAGVPPLPPYIRRETTRASDRERYQTVYAARRGAIAAPTAGLHFTAELIDEIRARGVKVVTITLHVGLGTFKPVKADDISDHVMESEWYEIPGEAAAAIADARNRGGRTVAIGTTTVRALESAARTGEVAAGSGETSIFITPGFQFRAVDALLTNFHLPESTLLMLVSAFAGTETIRTAYREAIDKRYLFYSYGDCMFLRAGLGARGSGFGAEDSGSGFGVKSRD